MEEEEIIKCECCDLKQVVKENLCEICWSWKAILSKYTNIYKEPSA